MGFTVTAIVIAVLAGIGTFYTWDRNKGLSLGLAVITLLAGAVGTIGDGGNIHIYTWSDPDSGRTYFVTDRGGICERNLEVLPE